MIELTEENSIDEYSVKTMVNKANILFFYSDYNEKEELGTRIYFQRANIWVEESYDEVKRLLL